FDFEAVVLESDGLWHYYRANSQPGTPWVKGNQISAQASGPASLIQSDYVVNGHGQLEVIVPEGATLVHYTGQAATTTGTARPTMNWSQSPESLPAGEIGPASLIQDSVKVNGHGTLHLVLQQGTSLVHYTWGGSGDWFKGDTITMKAAA